MKPFTDTLLYFLIAAAMQNVVLTAGFDSSLMVKITKRPGQLLRFGTLLIIFSTVTTALFFPIDQLLPATWIVKMLRPFIILSITSLVYLCAVAVLNRFPNVYRRIRHMVALAAFNNIVVGVALMINHQVSASFFPAIGIAAGAAVGFLLLSAVTAEAIQRMDNPEIPSSFRGLPATLVYLGLLALALMGFSPILKLRG